MLKNLRLLSLLFFVASLTAQAQTSLLDLEITIAKTVGTKEELLKEISEKGEFTFTYSNQIKVNEEVILPKVSGTIGHFLKEIFPNGNIKFTPLNNRIALSVIKNTVPKPKVVVSGTVYDKEIKEPLEYVNVYLEGTSQGTTTNKSGEFVFQALDSGTLSLAISHLGYEKVIIDVNENINKPLVVLLEARPLQLQEVVVEPKNPLDIIIKAIDRIPRNYSSKSHSVQGFQREYSTTSEGKVIQLMEVLFETSGSSVSQSSAVLDARFIEDKEEKEPLWSTGRGGFYSLGWAKVSGIRAPSAKSFLGIDLTGKNTLDKYYDFELIGTQILEGKEICVIEFDQKVKVRKPLLKGRLYIASESYAIAKITHELSPKGLKFLKSHQTWGGTTLSKPPKKIDIIQDYMETNYKPYGDKWYLHSLIMDAKFDASLVLLGATLSQKKGLIFHSERVITVIDTMAAANTESNMSKVGSIPTLQNFIKKEYEDYAALNDEKWGNQNFIKSDTSIAQIAEQLSANNSLWERNRSLESTKVAVLQKFKPHEIRQDLDYLKKWLPLIHPGVYWYTTQEDFEAQFDSVRSTVKKSKTEREVLNLISPLIESINCGHTQVYPSGTTLNYLKARDNYFPLDLWIKGSEAFLVSASNVIPKGARLVSVNEISTSDVVNRIRSNISSDGFNTTYKEFKLNKHFPFLYANYFPTPDTFHLGLDHSGGVHEVLVPGKTRKDILAEAQLPRLVCHDSTNTALLKIPSFNAKEGFPIFLKEAFLKIKEKGIENLVIDLRGNEGGPDEYGSLLYSYISKKAFRYYSSLEVATKDISILNHMTFDGIPFSKALPNYPARVAAQDGKYYYSEHHNLSVIQPQFDVFTGNVFVLTNGGTYSAASEFASIVKANKRGHLIGEETGGGYYGNCSLGTPNLILPSTKIRVAIPLAKYELAIPKMVDIGYGVLPDYQTSYSLNDILNGHDLEMKMCYELIKNKKN